MALGGEKKIAWKLHDLKKKSWGQGGPPGSAPGQIKKKHLGDYGRFATISLELLIY